MMTSKNGSVLVIVLWISFGLVAIAICFADAMSSELRASANRAAGLAADVDDLAPVGGQQGGGGKALQQQLVGQ